MAIAPELLPGPSGYGEADPTRQPMGVGALGSATDKLYPKSHEEHQELLSWCNNAFTAAQQARQSYEDRWKRYYKLYRSYMQRKLGDWHSTVFIPICFWIIETITPRLVAQLPKFVTHPVGPEDEFAAKHMETLLDYSVKESELYTELVKGFKSALKYGTGIMKTYHRTDIRRGRKMQRNIQPVMQTVPIPVIDPMTGEPMLDLDDQPVVETREVEIAQVDLGMTSQTFTYTGYDGPAAECIDIFNFWPAPEAHDIDSARYVIHRTYKEMSYIKRRVAEGIYRWPENLGPEEIADVSDEPHLQRLSLIGHGGGSTDVTRKPVELLEFWLDDGRKIVMANRKAIIQVIENPYDHSEKPFVRIVDYLAEHEFWGIGEIEPLEGLQDLQNALVNSRIDNVRLVLNAMFAVNPNKLVSLDDLEMRPGGIVRLTDDQDPSEVLHRIDLGDVTSSAFTEAQMTENTIEKVSGVSAYQMGLDSPSLNNTATGVAIIQEQGASRFGLKSKLAELMGLRRLGRHFGSILQQFMTEERTIRLTGPAGQLLFQTFDPESLQGALDYDIQEESTTQTETTRREQKMNLLQLVAAYAPQGVMAALEDVLDTFGVKDKSRFLQGAPPMMPQAQPGMPQQMPMQQGPPVDALGQMAALGGDPTQGTFGAQNADRMLAQIAASYQQAGGY